MWAAWVIIFPPWMLFIKNLLMVYSNQFNKQNKLNWCQSRPTDVETSQEKISIIKASCNGLSSFDSGLSPKAVNRQQIGVDLEGDVALNDRNDPQSCA